MSNHSFALAIKLQWTDVFTDELGYRVEQQVDGVWVEAEHVQPQAGNDTRLTAGWLKWVPLRVIAELPGRAVVLRAIELKDMLTPPSLKDGRA